ncbi:MAG: MFS transporter [Alcaligenaceae bacterium]|nr:MFS transporter [Alcaligenaceae bacterium]
MPSHFLKLPLPLAGLLALAVAMGIGRFAFTPILPMMQADMGLSLADGGWLASANYLGYLAGALVAARVPWTPSALLKRGLWLVVIMTAAMGITGLWASWLLWRFMAGVASAWVMVGTASLCIARLKAAGREGQGGTVFSGVGWGVAFAGLVCMALALGGASPTQAWLLLAVVALGGLVCASTLWRHPTDQQSPQALAANPPPATSVPIQNADDTALDAQAGGAGSLHWGLVWCYGIYGFGYILPATFLPAQARLLVPDPMLFSLAWPVFGLASGISTLIAARLQRRYTRREIWAGSQILMAIGVVLPLLIHSLAAIIVAAVCVGSTFMVITMVGLQEAQASVRPRLVKTQIAAMTASFAIGQLIGPLFFSITHIWFGADLGFALILGAIGLILGTIPILRPRGQPSTI